MVELPGGTVTFVFTDIEGSTRLLQALGPTYEDALATHRRLLRAAFSIHGGVEVDTQGDALFYAFARAHDALAGAIEAQRALMGHLWTEDVELRVRIGIHTGEPTVTDEGYVGEDVHLGARICSAAWGEQILVSDATARLLGQLPEASLRDLGEFSLKDIDDPVRLHQVIAPGLREDFPPPRTASSHPTNLPPDLDPLVGRAADTSELTSLLASSKTRIVTVTGPGGVGKTRLSLAVGQELLSSFADGVFFVDLSSLSDPASVPGAIATTLGLRESARRSITETLSDYLAPRQVLLILDNLEHLLGATPDISALVSSAPSLRVLVTSREPLRTAGEQEVPLAPLGLPSEDAETQEILSSPAVELFVARARALRPGFEPTSDDAASVVRVCRRLDGLPLAIELAAARTKVLSPAALASRLEQSLGALGQGRRDASERQRTLRGAIAWSYGLLTPEEQTLFRRLAVFAGGFTLDAAEAVCDRGDLSTDVLDGVASLVDKSLVRAREQDGRFVMLETIRSFAADELKVSGEAGDIYRRHAEWFAELARKIYPNLAGALQLQALNQLQLEDANLKSALEWAVTAEPLLALRLISDVWRSWWFRGRLTEARNWLDRTTDLSSCDHPSFAKAMRGLATVARGQGDLPVARQAAERSAAICQRFQDELGLAASLVTLADIAIGQGDLSSAKRFSEESRDLYAKSHDEIGVAVSLGNLGYIALLERRFDHSLALSKDSVRIHEQHQDMEGVGDSVLNMGYALLSSGRFDESLIMFERAQRIASELGYKELMWGALVGLASLSSHRDQLHQAASLLQAAKRTLEAAQISPQPFERDLYERIHLELASFIGPDGGRATDDGPHSKEVLDAS